ncbi:50S ribosomal protein L18, partial [Buchnera aphidicola (Hormaphis cornu)]
MLISKNKKKSRIRRGYKTRFHLKKLGAVRLVVHRTSRHIYAQVITINPVSIISVASTLEKNILKKQQYTGNKEAAVVVGRLIAER